MKSNLGIDKLKEILTLMDKSEDIKLDSFYETIEKENSNNITFTTFKQYFDKYYENISKSKNFEF